MVKLTLALLRFLYICRGVGGSHLFERNTRPNQQTNYFVSASTTTSSRRMMDSSSVNNSDLGAGSDNNSNSNDSLDTFWQAVSLAVRQGDFATYQSFYHSDAVYVSEMDRSSQPVRAKFADWKQGFEQTAQGKRVVTLDFMITKRLSSATTSHETGIFRYTSSSSKDINEDDNEEEEEPPVVAMLHFRSLLWRANPNQPWQFTMEYQGQPATDAEWKAAQGTG